MHFIGKTQARMDAKGRLFLPAEYRRQLEDGERKFVLRQDANAPCLVLYPYATWRADVNDVLARLNRWNPAEAQMLRRFMGDVEQVELDGNGRILIPRRLQGVFGDDRSVCFVGLGDRLELWPAGEAEKPFMESAEYASILQQIMSRQP